ncbi:MAG: Ig-like domain repeat protein, partial [Candidatus Helarchaeota archaeon]|nr:Ig-like domain repeat protein [Candidatus Helarchaeota archaeon]
PAGLWDFILSVEKPNYINHTQSLELYAKYNTSLSWILPPPDSIRPGDELTVSVNLTSLGAPVAGQNVTFIINTNIGPDPYNVTTLANGSAMLVGYFITSETTTLSIQVSFYGNVTIFPSTISQSVQVKTGGWLEEYWWVLVIVALVAVVGTAAVRARRKQKIAKEIAKKEIITSFQDVTKILHLVVIHKGTGTDIFDYKIQERLDPTLLAGFIQAVKDFGGELDQEER